MPDSARSARNGEERPSTPFLPDFAVPTATAPRQIPSDADVDHPFLIFNRELSWLDFNWRVLAQAMDPRTPLLERVRFLAITSSNLDDFFRKRVGGLKRQAAAGVKLPSPDGRDPAEQLALIGEASHIMYAAMCRTWNRTIRPLLSDEAGIHLHDYDELESPQREHADAYFRSAIFPILTPLAVDPGHPFPFISNLSLSLAITLRHPKRETEHFARLKVPSGRRRWIALPEPGHFVALEQVIGANVQELFRGMDVVSVQAFRITRNADIRRNEEEAEDLLEMMSDELRERRFAPVVRLEVDANMPQSVRRLLMRELTLDEGDVFENEGLIDYSDLHSLASLGSSEHRFEPWEPVTPSRLLHEGETKDRANIFDVLRAGDVLVHHPYESFRASVQRFIEEAAVDPEVLAIKQTLYRTSEESPIVEALIRAAEQGKQVAVLVEVKARFDEQSNMEWGQMLEKSGVHVTYGLVGLKTHCKTTLVVRSEEDGPRAYVHIGTGNYNPATARTYADVGLFTCSPDVTSDVINLFHYLTGYAPEQHYQKLLVAPRDMRRRFVELIHREVDYQERNGSGRIIAKMNALDDVEMIQQLYAASRAGVEIDLIVRGHCRLRPQVRGFSETIRVRSIVGRFLEHSRVYYFHNEGDPDIFIGSADWQRRNLEDRVEAVVPVEDSALKQRLINILKHSLGDRRTAWELESGGNYRQLMPEDDSEEQSALHDMLMRRIRHRTEEADAPWDVG